MVVITDEDFIKALEVVTPKIKSNHFDFNKAEKDCLKLVYDTIQEKIGSRSRLDISCSSCVGTGSKIVRNYMNQLGDIPVMTQKKAVVTNVGKEPNYKELLAMAKAKGFKGKNPKKQELIDFIS